MRRVAQPAIFLSVAMLGLSACEDGFKFGKDKDASSSDTAAPRAVATTGTTDVKRPDLFETKEKALWDGRPSLGGVWIAHPDVKDPERVIITNTSNGKSIAGALFRRERDAPGPKLQLSSDAAAALNILAGQPTEVTVVAVRQKEVVVEEKPPVISDEDVSDADKKDGKDGKAAAAAGAGAAASAETKPKGNFFQRLFGRKPKPSSAPLEASDTADSAAAPDVETQTLDPVTSGAAAAIARAESSDKPATARTSIEDTPAPSGVRNPFIQVGLFSSEENAKKASARLREAGVVPTVLRGKSGGKTVWRVVVGPVTSADEQAAILGKVRRLGYGDAFATKG